MSSAGPLLCYGVVAKWLRWGYFGSGTFGSVRLERGYIGLITLGLHWAHYVRVTVDSGYVRFWLRWVGLLSVHLRLGLGSNSIEAAVTLWLR